MKDIMYDQYIAIDWSNKNMAIARMTKKSNKITVIDVPSDIVELGIYLSKEGRWYICYFTEQYLSNLHSFQGLFPRAPRNAQHLPD